MSAHIAGFRLASPTPRRLAGFYSSALNFRTEDNGLRLGPSRLWIAEGAAPASGLPPSNDPRFQHFAIVVRRMEEAVAHLSACDGWTPITACGPQKLPAASGGATAFKFRDPDGHPLELLEFAPGAEPQVWRDAPGLFLGIDHTAMACSARMASVAFYAQFGFRVSAAQCNRGVEQSRLDGLGDEPGTEVEVVALSVAPPLDVPHIELLCYRRPPVRRDALPAGADALSTVILLESLNAPGGERSDPDGHRVEIGRTAQA